MGHVLNSYFYILFSVNNVANVSLDFCHVALWLCGFVYFTTCNLRFVPCQTADSQRSAKSYDLFDLDNPRTETTDQIHPSDFSEHCHSFL